MTYVTANGSIGQKKEKLVSDIKIVAADTNDLLNELTNLSGEEFLAARARIEARLAEAISGLRAARVETAKQVCKAASASRDYAKENPWKLIGIAAVGLVATILLSRSSSR